jgi:hypothetical protein
MTWRLVFRGSHVCFSWRLLSGCGACHLWSEGKVTLKGKAFVLRGIGLQKKVIFRGVQETFVVSHLWSTSLRVREHMDT